MQFNLLSSQTIKTICEKKKKSSNNKELKMKPGFFFFVVVSFTKPIEKLSVRLLSDFLRRKKEEWKVLKSPPLFRLVVVASPRQASSTSSIVG